MSDLLPIPTDPISAVADAVSQTVKVIGDMSAMTHPWIYMWKINCLTKRLVKEIKEDNRIVPEDLVGACCHDLDTAEQTFILHLVMQKLGRIK